MTEAINRSVGERRRSGVAVTILLLVTAMVCISIGVWQLRQGAEQRAAEVEASAASRLAPLDLRESPVFVHDAWRNAVVEGTYDPSQQFYLLGREHEGRTGYHVITALRIVGTRRYVLVNRGWLPDSADAAAVPPGRVLVRGVLVRPQLPPLRLHEPRGMTRPYIDPVVFARDSERSVAPLLLVAEEGAPDLVPAPVLPLTKQAVHLSYALQWFALAAMAFLATAVVLTRRVRRGG